MSFWSGFEEKRGKWILNENFILELKANDNDMDQEIDYKIYCCKS